VQGASAFRAQVAALAGIERLNVTFADGALEQQRVSARCDRGNVVGREHARAHTIYDKTDARNERDHGR
jgi:hypothetical protein